MRIMVGLAILAAAGGAGVTLAMPSEPTRITASEKRVLCDHFGCTGQVSRPALGQPLPAAASARMVDLPGATLQRSRTRLMLVEGGAVLIDAQSRVVLDVL